MRKLHSIPLVCGFTVSAFLSAPVVAQTINADIDCEPQNGYHLCQASPIDFDYDYTWTVTGGLVLSSASGPFVTPECWSSYSGTLNLTISDPNSDAEGTACQVIDCGVTDPTVRCDSSSGGSGGSGGPGGPGGPGDPGDPGEPPNDPN